MTIPERVNASWIATLGDQQLLRAEATLHAEFQQNESVEKQRRGARYAVLEGPEVLVNSWLRWLLVNNETKARGLQIRRRSR